MLSQSLLSPELADMSPEELMAKFQELRSEFADYRKIPAKKWHDMYHYCEVAYRDKSYPLAAFEMGLMLIYGDPREDRVGTIFGTYSSKYASPEAQRDLRIFWRDALLLCEEPLYRNTDMRNIIKNNLLHCAEEYLDQFMDAQNRKGRRMIFPALMIYELILEQESASQIESNVTLVHGKLLQIKREANANRSYCCFWRNGDYDEIINYCDQILNERFRDAHALKPTVSS